MKNFRASDMPGAASAQSASAVAPEVVEPPAPKVPAGTVTEVLSWVGGDKERAQAALDAENATGQPRKSLVYQLSEILGS